MFLQKKVLAKIFALLAQNATIHAQKATNRNIGFKTRPIYIDTHFGERTVFTSLSLKTCYETSLHFIHDKLARTTYLQQLPDIEAGLPDGFFFRPKIPI
jgi:hypothetical protein